MLLYLPINGQLSGMHLTNGGTTFDGWVPHYVRDFFQIFFRIFSLAIRWAVKFKREFTIFFICFPLTYLPIVFYR